MRSKLKKSNSIILILFLLCQHAAKSQLQLGTKSPENDTISLASLRDKASKYYKILRPPVISDSFCFCNQNDVRFYERNLDMLRKNYAHRLDLLDSVSTRELIKVLNTDTSPFTASDTLFRNFSIMMNSIFLRELARKIHAQQIGGGLVSTSYNVTIGGLRRTPRFEIKEISGSAAR